MSRRFTRHELYQAINNQLSSDMKSGVPFDGMCYMLARWVEGIVALELKHAKDDNVQVSEDPTHQG